MSCGNGWGHCGHQLDTAECGLQQTGWQNGLGTRSGGGACVVPTPSYAPGVWSSGSQNAEQCPHPELVRAGLPIAPLYSGLPVPEPQLSRSHSSELTMIFQLCSPHHCPDLPLTLPHLPVLKGQPPQLALIPSSPISLVVG